MALPSLLRPTPSRVSALAAAAVTGLVCLIVLAPPAGKRRALPGPLRSTHGPLTEDCGACHEASMEAIAGPFHGLQADALGELQSARCLVCHIDLGDSALLAHGWAPGQVPAPRAGGGARAHGLFTAPVNDRGELACAACHREHRGRSESLALLTDAQCQTCHAQQIDAFETDHPRIFEGQFLASGAIAFDHRSHLGPHFAEADAGTAPTSCLDCHTPDLAGDAMGLRGYAETCAACHDADILGLNQVEGAGLAVLGLPALDVLSLEERGLGVGDWPADAAVVETPVPEILGWLLEAFADGGGAELERALADADLLDLYEASEAQAEAAQAWALGLKAALQELAHGGQPALIARIEGALGRSLGPGEAAGLTGGLSAGVLEAAFAAWIPNLEQELGGEPGVSAEDWPLASVEADAGAEAWASRGGWYRQDLDYSLRYRARGHADPFLRAWSDLALELASRDAASPAALGLAELFTNPLTVGSCARCHTVEERGAAGRRWRWTATDLPRDLTRFSHTTHFPALGSEGCMRCHVLDDSTSPAELDLTPRLLGFEPLTESTCSSCHRSDGANDSCMTCHDYHVRSGPRLPISAGLVPASSRSGGFPGTAGKSPAAPASEGPR